MRGAPESKKFGRHSIIHSQIRLLCLNSVQIRGHRFILQFYGIFFKFENSLCFTVSPEQLHSHLFGAWNIHTGRERWRVKYFSQEGLRGSRELHSFQPEASAREDYHGGDSLECHPMACAGQSWEQAQPAQVWAPFPKWCSSSIRSCLTILISFCGKVTHLADEGKAIDVVYLDFSKAFDIVHHTILLERLAAHGLQGCTACCIKKWLNGQSQPVVVSAGNQS